MGEVVEPGFVKDYARFQQEALQRQERLKGESETIANFVLDLAGDDVDRSKAPGMVEDFVKSMMLDIAKADNGVAEQIFDKHTADGLREVKRLEDLGLVDQAVMAMRAVEQAAPGGGFCGAGGCGIEAVNRRSQEGKDLAKKLRADAGDKVVNDKVRKCACGGSVSYAYNKSRVKKLCHGCGAYENKQSIPTATAVAA